MEFLHSELVFRGRNSHVGGGNSDGQTPSLRQEISAREIAEITIDSSLFARLAWWNFEAIGPGNFVSSAAIVNCIDGFFLDKDATEEGRNEASNDRRKNAAR